MGNVGGVGGLGGKLPAGGSDPLTQAVADLNLLLKLLKDPSKNKVQILQVEKELHQLVKENPKIFSNLAQTDVYNFCADIEDYFMAPDPSVLGIAIGWAENIKMDFQSKLMPNIPKMPVQLQEDFYQLILDLEKKPPDIQGIKQLLSAIEGISLQGIPELLQNKIKQALQGVEQFLVNPTEENRGIAIGLAQGTLFAIWPSAPKESGIKHPYH